MQRKALKQLGKVTQWTNEKVFSGEKTQFSDEFTAVEKDIEPRRIGIERLHATSLPFFQQLTKVKPTADPYPPPGSGKEKILHTEALGLVMIDYGGDIDGPYGDALSKYGRARCKLAVVQEEFGSRLSDNYIAGMEQALAAVNDYKTVRKKLESRRLTLDAAITRLQGSKKDPRMLEEEVNIAQERFEEVEDEARLRLQAIEQQESDQFSGLSDLLDAELEYFGKCVQILEELRENWPSGSVNMPKRPRANTASSARSAGRARSYSRPSAPVSDDDEVTPGRVRSQSNASSLSKTKEKRSMLPSLGSFGKKSGLSLGGGSKRKAKYGQTEDDRLALHSEEDEDDEPPPRSPASYSNGRNRSNTALSASRVSLASDTYSVPPPLRRTQTTPSKVDVLYLKALYDFAGTAADELPLRAGQIVEVKKEVSDDWCIGESEGQSGLFPRTYCEEYVPTPVTAVPVPALPARQRSIPPLSGAPPIKRSLPPLANNNSNSNSNSTTTLAHSSPAMDYATDDSYDQDDTSIGGFDDGDHYATASLAHEAQPAPITSTTKQLLKKTAPPPPPPSRRSQSSSNLFTTATANNNNNKSTSSYLSPPQASFTRPRAGTTSLSRSSTLDSSPEASPFAGSGDEDDHHHHITNGNIDNNNNPTRGISTGLGGIHLARALDNTASPACATCGCEDFTQNVFKAKGICSTCFHSH